MKYIFITGLILLLSLAVWSERGPSNLRSHLFRRAAEDDEKPAPIAVGPTGVKIIENRKGREKPSASTTNKKYGLSDGSELVVSDIKTTFSCNGRIYGYYADVDNNCQIYHVCIPNRSLETGLDETARHSYFCGNQTIFDQQALVCRDQNDAFPCNKAASLYDNINKNFGITDPPN